VDELDEPVGPEFRKAFDEQNYGLPFEGIAEQFRSQDAAARREVLCHRRADPAGNRRHLAEILDNLAAVVRERFKIRRQVRVHTAHGRFTGYVLMALPPFLACVLMLINPSQMRLLFEERLGQMMILAASSCRPSGSSGSGRSSNRGVTVIALLPFSCVSCGSLLVTAVAYACFPRAHGRRQSAFA